MYHHLVEGYELEERIAAGGMAEIFRARSQTSGEQVIIKRILPQLAAHREFASLLEAEGRITAALNHPNVVALRGTGVADGQPFLVLEYLDGADLRNIMRRLHARRGRVPLEVTLTIVSELARALAHVHGAGFLHRDVSPQNVFLTRAGGVKLLDFGIAAARTAFRAKTPYRSPEQCRDEALDPRSDVFSLGILLYELSTGRRLFTGKSETEIVSQITGGNVPPPSLVRVGYPLALEEIVLKTLARRPEDRWQTATAVAIAIGDFARDRGADLSAAQVAAFVAEGLRK